MTEYLFVGGPADGRRMEIGEARIVRIPVASPVTVVAPKVIPFRRQRYANLTANIAEYERFGPIYWWEGLIKDAWAEVDVSEEVLAVGGPALRRLVREEMRERLQALDPDKGLGRIVWRVSHNRSTFRFTFKAFVGPRAVPFALKARDDRRAAIQSLERKRG